jgi:hypothetical protein
VLDVVAFHGFSHRIKSSCESHSLNKVLQRRNFRLLHCPKIILEIVLELVRDNGNLIQHPPCFPFSSALNIRRITDDRAEVLHLLDCGVEFRSDLEVFDWIIAWFDRQPRPYGTKVAREHSPPRSVLIPDKFALNTQAHALEGCVRCSGESCVVCGAVRRRIGGFSPISQTTSTVPTCTHWMNLSDLVPPCAREEARHRARTLPWVPSYPSSCTSGRSQPLKQVPPSA